VHWRRQPALKDVMPAGSTAAGTLVGLVAVLLWSASVGLVRNVAELLGPTAGAATIFSASGIFSAAAFGLPRPRSLNPVYLYAGGFLFIAYEISFALSLGLAQDRSQALELAMINYLWPCLTIVLAVAFRQQRGSLLLAPGVALCLLGVSWLVAGQGGWSGAALGRNIRSNPLAYGLAGSAAVTWAAYSVLTRKYGGGRNGVSLFLLATAAILWGMHGFDSEREMTFTLFGALLVLVLGAFSATAFACWNTGVQRGNLTVLAALSYFTPVCSTLLASVWLGVRPGASFWQGVAMVTAGSLICWWSTRRVPL
jgi:drug/metabolite transporter (DMT)-like permease